MIITMASDSCYPDVNPPNIIMPYANSKTNPAIWAATKLNIETQGFYPRYEDVSSTPFSYHLLINELWNEGEKFILVEHDVLPWPGALTQLWECDCAWGAFQYLIFGNMRAYLGCVKFDPSKIIDCPTPQELCEWQRLDQIMIKELMTRGERVHVHDPPVSHLNFSHQRMTRNTRTPTFQ
jgi:hypothetical protein